MALEYFSFEKVLKELQMDEDELKRLVSEGQIRAFRDEDKMKFRADDIVGLKKGRQTEPTIILPPTEDGDGGDDIMLVDDDTDETLLDLEDLGADDIGESDETSIPSLDLDEDDSSADTLTEELVFDDDLGLEDGAETDEIATQETFIDDDDEVGMTTEPLDLDDEEEDEKPKTVIATRRGGATVRAPRGSGRVSGPAVPMEEEEISPLMLGLSIVAALILLFVGLLLMDVARVSHTGISGSVAAMVQKNLTDDGEPVWFESDKKKGGDAGEEDEGGEEEEEEPSEEEEE